MFSVFHTITIGIHWYLVLKPDIMEELEKQRDAELTERKEKRQKDAEEELRQKQVILCYL